MNYLYRLIARIGAWFRRTELDRDLDEVSEPVGLDRVPGDTRVHTGTLTPGPV